MINQNKESKEDLKYCLDCGKKTFFVEGVNKSFCLVCYPEKKCPFCERLMCSLTYCMFCGFDARNFVMHKNCARRIRKSGKKVRVWFKNYFLLQKVKNEKVVQKSVNKRFSDFYD